MVKFTEDRWILASDGAGPLAPALSWSRYFSFFFSSSRGAGGAIV
jgi:hypothetical protein